MKLFIPACQDGNGAILDADETHYLLRVRRLCDGDSLACVDLQGGSWNGILRVKSGLVRIERISGHGSLVSPLDDDPPVHLVQGIPKGRKLDDIIRQACEQGVCSIYPWCSQYAIPKLDEKWEVKEKRYDTIIREAAQQSGNMKKPLLHPPMGTREILEEMKTAKSRGIVFYEKDIAHGSLHRYLFESEAPVYVFIGPEGGISHSELDLFSQAGCFFASLGPTILRTETAGVAAVASIMTLLREQGSWRLT